MSSMHASSSKFVSYKNCFPLYYQVMLMNNLILSEVGYCNTILANATKNDLKQL